MTDSPSPVDCFSRSFGAVRCVMRGDGIAGRIGRALRSLLLTDMALKGPPVTEESCTEFRTAARPLWEAAAALRP